VDQGVGLPVGRAVVVPVDGNTEFRRDDVAREALKLAFGPRSSRRYYGSST
jgi:hypothetical protein